MIIALVIAAILGSFYGLAVPSIALVFIVYFLADILYIPLHWTYALYFLPLTLVIPITIGCVASLSEHLAFDNKKVTSLVPLSIVAALVYLLDTVDVADQLFLVMLRLPQQSYTELSLFIVGMIGKAVSVGLLVSFTVVALTALCEFPFLLFGQGLCSISLAPLAQKLRPLILLTIFSFAIQGLISMFVGGL